MDIAQLKSLMDEKLHSAKSALKECACKDVLKDGTTSGDTNNGEGSSMGGGFFGSCDEDPENKQKTTNEEHLQEFLHTVYKSYGLSGHFAKVKSHKKKEDAEAHAKKLNDLRVNKDSEDSPHSYIVKKTIGFESMMNSFKKDAGLNEYSNIDDIPTSVLVSLPPSKNRNNDKNRAYDTSSSLLGESYETKDQPAPEEITKKNAFDDKDGSEEEVNETYKVGDKVKVHDPKNELGKNWHNKTATVTHNGPHIEKRGQYLAFSVNGDELRGIHHSWVSPLKENAQNYSPYATGDKVVTPSGQGTITNVNGSNGYHKVDMGGGKTDIFHHSELSPVNEGILDEAGRRWIIKLNSKGVRRKKLQCPKGQKSKRKNNTSTCVPEKSAERLNRKRGSRKAVRKRKSHSQRRSNMLRKRAMQRRRSMGLSKKKH